MFVLTVQFWLESGKNMQEYVHFLYFLQLFCRYSLFFSPGRDQLLGRAGQKNISPGISPHDLDPRAEQLYLTWSICLGQKSSIKGNTSISI